MKILVIEDDSAIKETINLSFRVGWSEAKVLSTSLGQEGIELVETEAPDVIILDLGLPDINGFEVLKRVRTFSNIPILVLTQNEEEKSVIKALDWGADGYITKPFRQLELLARIKSLIRRQYGTAGVMTATIGPFYLDFDKYQLRFKSRLINLTRTEFIVFRQLALNMGKVVSNSNLAERIWEANYPGSADAIRVYIRHLREKLEINPNKPQLIITKPGIGYMLVNPN